MNLDTLICKVLKRVNFKEQGKNTVPHLKANDMEHGNKGIYLYETGV